MIGSTADGSPRIQTLYLYACIWRLADDHVRAMEGIVALLW
jgi:hypothetical protein